MNESVQTPSSPEADTSSQAMLRALSVVAAISGFLVVLAYQVTLPMIEENKREAIENALYKVVPGAISRLDFVANDEGVFPAGEEARGIPIYAGYDATGQLKGVALEAAAPGYQDVVRVLYGYDPYCECIRGIQVLKMAETPGIGDKITTDKSFLENFIALSARVSDAGDSLANAIVTVRHGTKTRPWQIDAISGATITSKAVGRMLNSSGQQVIPIIQKNLALLEKGL